MATLLYERGARLNVENIPGWTPLRIADGLFVAGFYTSQPQTAALLREFYQREGMAVPPPNVNDTDLLTLDKAQAEAAAKQYGCSYVGLCKDCEKPGDKAAAAPVGQQVKPDNKEASVLYFTSKDEGGG